MKVCCKSFCCVILWTKKSFLVEIALCSLCLPFLIDECHKWCQLDDVWYSYVSHLACLHMDKNGPSKCKLQPHAPFMTTGSPSFKYSTPICPKAQHSWVNKSFAEYPVKYELSISNELLEAYFWSCLSWYIMCPLSEVQLCILSYKVPACYFKPFCPGFPLTIPDNLLCPLDGKIHLNWLSFPRLVMAWQT